VTVSLRWLGGGGFTLRVGRRLLALDPCLGRLAGEGRAAAGPDELRLGLALPWCDCILVSGSSREGLADVQCVARRTGALVAAPPDACRSLALLGLPARQVRPMRPGSTLPVAGFSIEALPARRGRHDLGFRVRAGLITLLTAPWSGHSSASWSGHRTDPWAGHRTACAAEASAGLRADIVLAGPRDRCGVLARALAMARPRLVVACRAETTWLRRSPPRFGAGERRVAEAIRQAGVQARLFVPEILRENDLRCLL
jgi:hypothetical protein